MQRAIDASWIICGRSISRNWGLEKSIQTLLQNARSQAPDIG